MKNIIKNLILGVVTFEARLVLKKYRPKIIAITGNIGKTTTKDAIYAVVATKYHARKSAKSFNSEFGVPLTVLGVDYLPGSNIFGWLKILFEGFELIVFKEDYPKVLVLEVGADHKGDIGRIVRFVHPDITVITQFQPVPVHIENFSSREELITEKGKLVKGTKKSGIIIYTHDDHDAHELAKTSNLTLKSYGFHEGSLIRAVRTDTLYEQVGNVEYPTGTGARIEMGNMSIPLIIPGVLGGGYIYAGLAALLVGNELGINLIEGGQAIGAMPKAPGRMRVLKGVKYSTVIDDTYNASPKAVEHALKTLAGLHTDGKKIAVLGDMLELGKQSIEEHERIGKIVSETAHYLVTVGKRAQVIAESALSNGMSENCVLSCDTSREACKVVENLIEAEDIILVKGSQGMRMEFIVEEIMAEPDRKEELLPRQDREWKK